MKSASQNKLTRFDRSQPPMDGEDYYSSLARRVYYLAEVESWPYAQTVKMLNDKEGFERYYENVSVLTSILLS